MFAATNFTLLVNLNPGYVFILLIAYVSLIFPVCIGIHKSVKVLAATESSGRKVKTFFQEHGKIVSTLLCFFATALTLIPIVYFSIGKAQETTYETTIEQIRTENSKYATKYFAMYFDPDGDAHSIEINREQSLELEEGTHLTIKEMESYSFLGDVYLAQLIEPTLP